MLGEALTDADGAFVLTADGPVQPDAVYFVATRLGGQLFIGPMLRPPLTDLEYVLEAGAGATPFEPDGALCRQDFDASHPGGSCIHHVGVSAARVFDPEMECAVLLWRNIVADYRGGHHGLHVAGSGVRDVTSVRKFAQEGKFQRDRASGQVTRYGEG
jgi:hypothetical protein